MENQKVEILHIIRAGGSDPTSTTALRVSGATLARPNRIAWEGRKSLRSRTIGRAARMHDATDATVILLQMGNASKLKPG